MATSYVGSFTPAGDGLSWVTVANRNGSISGGTSLPLPTNEQGENILIYAAFQRCFRAVMNAFSAGTIDENDTILVALTVDNGDDPITYVSTANYGGSISGGTTITLPTNETGTSVLPFLAAFDRFARAILNDRSAGN